MRKLVLSGLAALAAGLGGPVLLASAPASAATAPTALQPASVRPADVEDVAVVGSKVSCASPTECLAVGTNNDRYGDQTIPVAAALHTATWKNVAVPEPKGSVAATLTGVSCISATSCIATGAAGSEKVGHAAALSFNGAKWSVLPVPGAGQGLTSAFEGVSCPKAGHCVAIGEYGLAASNNGRLLAGYWNGAAWKLKPA